MSDFYIKLIEIQKLKCIEKPDTKDFTGLLPLVSGDEELMRVFYEEDEATGSLTPGWFPLLYSNGMFDDLEADEVKTKLSRWHKTKYLQRVASEHPKEMLDLVTKLQPKDGTIQSIFLEILSTLPPKFIKRGYSVIEKALKKDQKFPSDWVWFGKPAVKIAEKMITEDTELALNIYGLLLEIWRDNKKVYGRDESRFRGHEYSDLLSKHYSQFWKAHPSKATQQLLKILDNYFESSEKETDDPSEYLYITIEDLSNISCRYSSDYVAPLLQTICKAGRQIIEKEPTKIDELLEIVIVKE